MDPESKTSVLIRGGGDIQRRGQVRTQAEIREMHPGAKEGLGLLDAPEGKGRKDSRLEPHLASSLYVSSPSYKDRSLGLRVHSNPI